MFGLVGVCGLCDLIVCANVLCGLSNLVGVVGVFGMCVCAFVWVCFVVFGRCDRVCVRLCECSVVWLVLSFGCVWVCDVNAFVCLVY